MSIEPILFWLFVVCLCCYGHWWIAGALVAFLACRVISIPQPNEPW